MTEETNPLLMDVMSYGAALKHWADINPDAPLLTDDQRTLTRREFDLATNRYARFLQEKGVGEGDIVTLALPNEADLLIYLFACWKLGAAPQTLSPRMSQKEFQEIVEVGQPKIVIGVEEGFVTGTSILPYGTEVPASLSDDALPDVIAPISRAPVSGGSTGRPKVILIKVPAVVGPAMGAIYRINPEETHVVPGRLYHGAPLICTSIAMGLGCHVVLMRKFDEEETLKQIDQHKADYVFLVPTMMSRMVKLPDDVKAKYDLLSLKTAFHTAAPCPAWLKQAWVEWVDPKVILELYGMSEGLGATTIDGAEWLTHKGSVGRPVSWCEMQIVDDDGNEVARGDVGEVYMRPVGFEPPYEYVEETTKKRQLPGGWESAGDMGYLDDDGYLFLADRRTDMILVGGANVYPAEVEAALESHPAVRSSAVIGLPDDDMGNQVHAIVNAVEAVLDDELLNHLKKHLTPYKLPRSFEFVETPLRGDDGKVRRSALRAERIAS